MKSLLIGAALLLSGSTAFAEVQLSLQDGRVSIVAKDATVRQILTEWARVGQTKIVNVERIPGGPMTIELTNVPEQQALDILLRSLSGYVAAPRPVAAGNLSSFDRIVVMATAAAPRPATAAPAPGPTFAQPQFAQPPMPTDDDVDDDRPAPNVAMPNPRGPVFNTFPQPQVVNPQMPMPNGMAPGQQMAPQQVPVQQAPTAYPTMPNGGVAVPGMVVQPPQQPGQVPGQPGAMPIPPQNQTGQPIRRPGGADFDEDR